MIIYRKAAIRLVAVAVLASVPFGTARGDVILGASGAYGESVSLTFTPNALFSTLLAPATFTSGPYPAVAGVAPPPYSISGAFVSPVIVPPALTITASGFPLNASSDVNGTPGIRYADANASLASLNLALGLFLPATPISPPISVTVASLTIDGMSSMANVTGDFPLLIPSGSTSFADFTLSFPLLPAAGSYTFSAYAPAPNTQLIPAAFTGTLSVLLNEQTFFGNFATFEAIDVNAVDISFSGIPVLPVGSVSGSIIISHTDALLVAVPSVPEPHSIILCCAGAASMIGYRWRRREVRS